MFELRLIGLSLAITECVLIAYCEKEWRKWKETSLITKYYASLRTHLKTSDLRNFGFMRVSYSYCWSFHDSWPLNLCEFREECQTNQGQNSTRFAALVEVAKLLHFCMEASDYIAMAALRFNGSKSSLFAELGSG